MRLIYFLFLAVLVGAAGFLAYENQQEVPLKVLDRAFTTSVPVLVGLTYLAGMLSGWTVLGLVRRSVRRVIQNSRPGE